MPSPAGPHVDKFLLPVDPEGAIVAFAALLAGELPGSNNADFEAVFPKIVPLVKKWRSVDAAGQETLMRVCYLRVVDQVKQAVPASLTSTASAMTALNSSNVIGSLEDDFLGELVVRSDLRSRRNPFLRERLDRAGEAVLLLRHELLAVGRNLLDFLEAKAQLDPLTTSVEVLGREVFAWVVLMTLIVTFPANPEKG